MMRKHRGAKVEGQESGGKGAVGGCAVCGLSDARALIAVDLSGGSRVTLCGSHELMHRRAGAMARSVAELRTAFEERRDVQRRGGRGEVDELAEKLSAAFTSDRRGADRRAS